MSPMHKMDDTSTFIVRMNHPCALCKKTQVSFKEKFSVCDNCMEGLKAHAAKQASILTKDKLYSVVSWAGFALAYLYMCGFLYVGIRTWQIPIACVGGMLLAIMPAVHAQRVNRRGN